MVEAALSYLKRGWSVFPLIPRGKIAAGSILPKACTWPRKGEAEIKGRWESYQYSPALECEVREWWARAPHANIAIVTGKVSGFFVVDIDGEEGLAEWQALACGHEPINTLTAITGSGGLHLLFRWVDALNIGNSPISKNVHIRGQGGYIAAAPSVHPNFRRYAWREGTRCVEDAPIWLLELLVCDRAPARLATTPPPVETPPSNSYAQAALRDACERIRSTGEGARNDTLNREAFSIGAFVRDGLLERASVEAELFSAALASGLAHAEVEKTLRSGLDSALTRSQRVITPRPQVRNESSRAIVSRRPLGFDQRQAARVRRLGAQ